MKNKVVLFCILSGFVLTSAYSQAKVDVSNNSSTQLVFGDGLDSDFASTALPGKHKKSKKARRGKRGNKGERNAKRNPRKRMKKICAKAALTPVQEKEIQQGIVDLKKNRNTLIAIVKNARIDFRQSLKSETSTAEEIDSAIEAIGLAVGNLAVSGPNFKANLVNDILEPSQKKAGLRCVNAKMKLMHKHNRGHKRGQRKHRGNGHHGRH